MQMKEPARTLDVYVRIRDPAHREGNGILYYSHKPYDRRDTGGLSDCREYEALCGSSEGPGSTPCGFNDASGLIDIIEGAIRLVDGFRGASTGTQLIRLDFQDILWSGYRESPSEHMHKVDETLSMSQGEMLGLVDAVREHYKGRNISVELLGRAQQPVRAAEVMAAYPAWRNYVP